MKDHLRGSLVRTTALAAAVGVAALSLLPVAMGKYDLLGTLGIRSAQETALADNSCVMPHEQGDEVYFVSCGGFF